MYIHNIYIKETKKIVFIVVNKENESDFAFTAAKNITHIKSIISNKLYYIIHYLSLYIFY